MKITVNSFEWNDGGDTVHLCTKCKQKTTGQIEGRAYCLDCAMKHIFTTLKEAFQP